MRLPFHARVSQPYRRAAGRFSALAQGCAAACAAGLLSLGMAATARAQADLFWHASVPATGVHALGREVSVTVSPGKTSPPIPQGAVITRVHLASQWPGNGRVGIQLCFDGGAPCVALQGQNLNTSAFAGLPASRPLELRHIVHGWGQPPLSPLYIRSQLTVWYRQAPQAHSNPPPGHPE